MFVPWREGVYSLKVKASSLLPKMATVPHAAASALCGGKASLKDWALTRLQMPTSPLTRPLKTSPIFPVEKLETQKYQPEQDGRPHEGSEAFTPS